jgi:putative transcriptional regulator
VNATRETLEEIDAERGVAARAVRRAPQRTGLSQAKFAEWYHINLARLKDWEQGRFTPDTVTLACLKVIEHDPEAVEPALNGV